MMKKQLIIFILAVFIAMPFIYSLEVDDISASISSLTIPLYANSRGSPSTATRERTILAWGSFYFVTSLQNCKDNYAQRQHEKSFSSISKGTWASWRIINPDPDFFPVKLCLRVSTTSSTGPLCSLDFVRRDDYPYRLSITPWISTRYCPYNSGSSDYVGIDSPDLFYTAGQINQPS